MFNKFSLHLQLQGQVGFVHHICDSGDLLVRYTSGNWLLNPGAVVKVYTQGILVCYMYKNNARQTYNTNLCCMFLKAHIELVIFVGVNIHKK